MTMQALNVARFIALIGMLYGMLAIIRPSGYLPFYTEWLSNFGNGPAQAMFLILLGLQFGLGRLRARPSLMQAMILAVIGLILMLLFPASILFTLGLALAFAVLVREKAAPYTLWIAIVIVLGWVLIAVYVDHRAGWDMNGNYIFSSPSGVLRSVLFNGFYPIIPWASFLLIGMWLATRNLTSSALPRRLFVGGVLGALLVKALSGMAATPKLGLGELVALTPLPPNPFFVTYATAFAFALIGAILWVTPRFGTAAAFLSVPGEMPFTLYILMTGLVIIIGAMSDLLPPALGPGMLTIQISAALLLFAHIWIRIMPAGPLEGLLAKFR